MSHPTQILGKLCYALVNCPEAPHRPLILGLFRSAEAAVGEFAKNHELVRVEQRDQLRFVAPLKTPATWAIHQIAMDMVHSCGVLQSTHAVRLEFDGQYKVGRILNDHVPRRVTAESSNEDVVFDKPQKD